MIIANEIFLQPSLDWFALSPFTILLGAGVLSLLVETFASRSIRRPLQLILVFSALIASFLMSGLLLGTQTLTAGDAVAIDGPGVALQAIIALVALVGAAGLAENKVDPSGDAFAARASAIPGSSDERAFTQAGWYSTEIWTLFLFAVGGMQLFVVANDLLTMFIALEVMSLPLYLMAGMARRRRLLSQEAALKYFVLGAYSSAFFLFGAALVYGATGAINFDDIAFAIPARPQNAFLLTTGVILILVGMLFKVGSAPFHQWTPDVYQGAPTTLTAFMAAGVKVAAFGAMMRLVYSAFGSIIWDWRPILWAITLITMFVGVLAALVQTDIKRMLAYSSVAHAGFVLVGIISGTNAGVISILFYLAAYAFTTLGIFLLVSLIRDASGEASGIDSWRGLATKSPLTALTITYLLLALAGFPLTSGFISKFSVFAAAVQAGQTPLVLFAVLASAIAVVFYLRIVVLMYFRSPESNEVAVAIPSNFTIIALVVSVLITLILGIYPQPLFDLLAQSPLFIR
jgi:NADH-quinone oxidoreductase subunit N